MNQNHYILTIAGHDPSAGAGLTSDVKTFQAHGLYGLSVCTAVTIQNDIEFKDCLWTATPVILSQIKTLFKRFSITTVKIGIVESWHTLLNILEQLHVLNPKVTIILDPVLKATAGYDFHITENQDLLDQIWQKCFIVTPNYNEIQQLYPNLSIQDTISHISSFTNVYLKGGHRTDKKGWDTLYYNKTQVLNIHPKTAHISEKHGSGCVLSAALASNIESQYPLKDAAIEAKAYTETFLNSNRSLLGTHTQNTIHTLSNSK
ncbi:hydroxymethylpyrimidine/phosphomethylpyrimidine kinase [Hyunsoonleella sp. 2307UL5-6]|uniref:hydroxymethylpyrimidine/phosphomethylpyrimidine kinase n=1 Tax=Hyunsoonleella sp. 2307UL5-6 TaxID=3384768 RepID=UPI0039BC96AF